MSEARGSILISTANKIGAALVKKLGGTGYTPSEWADKINLLGKLPEDTVSGAIANFPDGADDVPVVELISNIAPSQAGSGDPAPDNVRAISGFTGMRITKQGKNLIRNTSFTYGLPSTAIGSSIDTITSSTRYAYNGSNIKGGSYTISVVSNDTDSFNSALYYGYSNGILVIYGQATINGSKTVDFSTCDFIRIAIGARTASIQVPTDLTEYGTLQVEVGSTATAYEPYTAPEVKSISWETEAGTVYGGSLNVTTGEMTVNSKYITFNSLTWYTNNLNGAQQFYSVLDDSVVPPNNNTVLSGLYCDSYLVVAANTVYTDTSVGNKVSINTGNALQIRDYSVTTLEDFKEKSKNFVLVYPLANPEVYQLDPVEVNTLLGVNNIYNDTNGDTEVNYRADTDLYIAKKLAE